MIGFTVTRYLPSRTTRRLSLFFLFFFFARCLRALCSRNFLGGSGRSVIDAKKKRGRREVEPRRSISERTLAIFRDSTCIYRALARSSDLIVRFSRKLVWIVRHTVHVRDTILLSQFSRSKREYRDAKIVVKTAIERGKKSVSCKLTSPIVPYSRNPPPGLSAFGRNCNEQ